MAPGDRNEPQLQAQAAGVALNIQMLVFAAGELTGIWESPNCPAADHRERMAADCFLLYFRNLSEFLLARAAEYGAPLDEDLTGALINERTFVERAIDYDMNAGLSRITRPEITRMYLEIEEALKRFLSRIDRRRLAWFLSMEETVNAISFMEPLRSLLAETRSN